MKKLLAVLGISAAAVVMLAINTPQSHASTVAKAAPALVINDFGCGVIGGVTFDTHAVVTSSGNGVLKCNADVAPPASGHAENYNYDNTGLTCGTPAGPTQDWKQTTSASGNATLTCKVH